jgi:hypothetical protein
VRFAGNDYDNAFEVTTAKGQGHTFDSFECAIHSLAPECAHCGCKIVGHGLQSEDSIYCCAHCARESGEARSSGPELRASREDDLVCAGAAFGSMKVHSVDS